MNPAGGVLFLVAASLGSQTQGSVQGIVRSAQSSEPIAYASVEIESLETGALTDGAGYFVLVRIPPGTWRVRASALGYASVERSVEVPRGGTAQVDFLLTLDPVRIPGITAEAARSADPAGPGGVGIDVEAARVVPALAEPDVLRAVQILPSVTPASDYSSALYIRGGSPGQTLVLLDEFPVFNPYHFGGVFGAFSPDAVASVEVMPGALPARYGDRLASVVGVRTREGGRNEWGGSGGAGLLSLRAAVDGPLSEGAGSYLVSARRSHLDFLGGGVSGEGVIPSDLSSGFQDLLVRVTHNVGLYGSLSALAFADQEWLRSPENLRDVVDYDWGWGNRLAGLSFRRPLGAGTLLEVRMGWADFHTALDSWWLGTGTAQGREQTSHARGSLRDLLAGVDLRAFAGGHELSVGVQAELYAMDYDSWRTEDPPEGFFESYVPNLVLEEELRTFSAYLEDEWRVSRRLRLRAGIRTLSAEGMGTQWGPRLGARMDVAAGLALNLGAGRYLQAVQSIRSEEAVGTNFMAYDLLRPGSLGMSVSEDAVVGVDWTRGAVSLRMDGYVKRMRDLALPSLPLDPRHAQVIEGEDFLPASGEAYGLEVLGQYGSGLVGVWLSYALAWIRRTVDGVTYTPRFERRHTVDLMARISLPEDARLTVRNVFATGQPTTPADGALWPPEFDQTRGGFRNERPPKTFLLAGHNSERTPPYWRIDVGGRFSFERELWGRTVSFSPYVELLNALNVGNVVFWEPSQDPNRPDDPFLQLPTTLTAGIEWSF